jgi:hypothetical protein
MVPAPYRPGRCRGGPFETHSCCALKRRAGRIRHARDRDPGGSPPENLSGVLPIHRHLQRAQPSEFEPSCARARISVRSRRILHPVHLRSRPLSSLRLRRPSPVGRRCPCILRIAALPHPSHEQTWGSAFRTLWRVRATQGLASFEYASCHLQFCRVRIRGGLIPAVGKMMRCRMASIRASASRSYPAQVVAVRPSRPEATGPRSSRGRRRRPAGVSAPGLERDVCPKAQSNAMRCAGSVRTPDGSQSHPGAGGSLAGRAACGGLRSFTS